VGPPLASGGLVGLGRKNIWGLGAMLVVGAGLVVSPVSAQTGTLAESLFRDARAAMKDGDAARACPLFAESYRLDPAYGTLFNLGVCEEQRGMLASAWAAFTKLMDVAPPDDERVIEASARLSAMERRVPRLRLVLAEPLPAEHALELDGVILGPGAVAGVLRVDPGKHTLRVIGMGDPVRSTELEVAEGQTLIHEVEPVVATPRLAPSVPVRRDVVRRQAGRPEPRRATGTTYAGYTALGLGGASLVASLSLGVLAIRARDATDAHCLERVCDPEGMAAGERGARYASLATAGAVAGLVGIVTGGFLVWTSPDGSLRVNVTGSRAGLEGAF
jgi:hypothetical protein